MLIRQLSGRTWGLAVLLCVLGAMPSSVARADSEAAARPMNVLFIAIDDLRTELGCYGQSHVQSPHLDQFARTAMRFDNHFVQVATCGASRYALLTGRSPRNSQAMGNAALYQGKARILAEPQAGAQSLPELFRRSGYHTVCIGKISHTADGRVYAYNGSGDGRDEVPHAWDELATPFGPWKRGWGIFFAYADGKHREDGQGHRDLMQFQVESDDDLPDGMMATRAMEKLRQLKADEKPFFMGLGFFKPHLPFVAPRQDWEAFADVEIPPPPVPEKIDSPHWHPSGEFYKYAMALQKTRPLSAADQLTARRAYLACVRYVDRQVGRVLTELDRLGLANNTLVVVWGDHGWHLGDSAIWGKHTPLERAVRSTLLMRVPGMTQPGTSTTALVETIDLFPTLLDVCGPNFTQTHYPLDGMSLRPVLEKPRDERGIRQVREASFSYWRNSVSVRTPDYRLVYTPARNKQPAHAELYDLKRSVDRPVSQDLNDPRITGLMKRYLQP